MPEYELLDSRPEREPWIRRGTRRGLVTALGFVLAGSVGLASVLRDNDRPTPECREERGAAWCTTPFGILTDAAVVSLVRGYCPRLRSLRLAEVVPRPLTDAGVRARPGEVVLRTTSAGARVESGLLGRPGALAWVIHRVPDGPWQLQIVCHNGADPVPALELDDNQLRSTLRADAGQGGLDLREVARHTTRTLGLGPDSRLSLGTLRCRTSRSDLALEVGARFGCSLPLFSDQGQALHRVTYEVRAQPPYLRRIS